MTKMVASVLLIFLAIMPIIAQDDDIQPIPIDQLGYSEVDIVYNVVDFVIDSLDGQYTVISPDGRYLAWFNNSDDQICLYTLANAETDCSSIPAGEFIISPGVIMWSPDSQYIAFAPEAVDSLREPDIWLYDLTDASIRNLTDDNVDGRIPFALDSDALADVDMSFTWGADNELYVYRYVLNAERDINDSAMGIYRISPKTGESILLSDLTGLFRPQSIDFPRIVQLDGPMSVSPDGRYIALAVFQSSRSRSEANGVWVIDVLRGGEATQLLTLDDLDEGAPSYYLTEANAGVFVPIGISWTNDSQSLFVMSENTRIATSFVNSRLLFHVNTISGTITPLSDLSRFTDRRLTRVGDNPEVSARLYPAYHAIITPNRDGLLVLTWDFYTLGQLWTMQVTDTEVTETLLYTNDEIVGWGGAYLMPSVAYDGTVLLGNFIFRLSDSF